MEKKVIMLACAAGMSTSLLVSKCRKQLQRRALMQKFCSGSSGGSGLCRKQHVDVVLLGPQVRFMEADFKKKWSQKEFQSVLFQWLITE